MSPTDFLRKEAETPLCEYFIAAGAVCSFSTNCEHLLEAAHESFVPAGSQPKDVDFSIRFWVDRADAAQPPWPKPYVRGLGHLVFGGFDAGSSMLADLRGRRVIGRFSQAMAADIDVLEESDFSDAVVGCGWLGRVRRAARFMRGQRSAWADSDGAISIRQVYVGHGVD